MGGTSCDVCVIEASQVAETAERVIAGRPLSLPALDIHTVGAGGGSIAWQDAGARCASVPVRGRPARAGLLRARRHRADRDRREPPVGQAAGRRAAGRRPSVDRAAAERAVGSLAADLGMDGVACAEGIVRVAENEMLGALRLMTVERGVDPRGFALMPLAAPGRCMPRRWRASWASRGS